jgi:phosphohistidine phosphatase
MKKLIIVRHAKSEWKAGVSDFDRPLNESGVRVAPKMGQALIDLGVEPDYVVCSPSKRTNQTATLLLNGIYDLKTINYQELIYNASFFELLQLINNDIPDNVNTLLIVGHNPGVSELIEYLSSANIGGMPTCSCVCITAGIDSWQLASKDVFLLDWNIYPKMFSY